MHWRVKRPFKNNWQHSKLTWRRRRRSVELAQKRYKQGIDTYLNMLDAQRTLYTAQTSLIGVQQIQTNNLITLYKVLGGGVSDVAKE